MFEKSFITDCEGPLTLNDNAFEMAAKFIEDGGELFKILSLYDDYLVEKNHVVPSSSQDEALSRYSVSGEVPR